MIRQSKPMSETRPQLVFGVAIMLFVFAVSGAGLYLLGQWAQPNAVPEAAATDDYSTTTTTPGGPVAVTHVAKNLAFVKRTITASPGAAITVTLNNQDAGVSHNVSFYTNKSATTKIFVGDLDPGPATRDEKFTAPTAPGNYFFRCDVHPDQMTGTFVVK
jgi:plastocyanin